VARRQYFVLRGRGKKSAEFPRQEHKSSVDGLLLLLLLVRAIGLQNKTEFISTHSALGWAARRIYLFTFPPSNSQRGPEVGCLFLAHWEQKRLNKSCPFPNAALDEKWKVDYYLAVSTLQEGVLFYPGLSLVFLLLVAF